MTRGNILGAFLGVVILFAVQAPSIIPGAENITLSNCEGDKGSRLECWNDALDQTIRGQGFEAAFDLLLAMYVKEPDFADNCHDYMHKLGQTAYDLFAAGKDFELREETAYCGFGFYHGFMQALVAKGANFQEARDFCSKMQKDENIRIQRGGLACFHGIGHGWATIHENKSGAWGNEENIVKPALALCKQVAMDEHTRWRCNSGVFDSIAIAYYNHLYGLSMKESDPMWLCKKQADSITRDACYGELMTALHWSTGYDSSKTIDLVIKYVEAEYLPRVIQATASLSIRDLIRTGGYRAAVIKCESLDKPLRDACITGLAEGFYQFGTPGKEHLDMLSLCNQSYLSESSKDRCLDSAISSVIYNHPEGTAREFCEELSERYRDICLSRIRS